MEQIVKTQYKVEFVVILILGLFLYLTISTFGDQSFIWKLFQLSIATFASGMLIHSWVRWQTQINLDKNKESGIYKENIYGYIWPFWLTLSILGWSIFGQDLFWDITETMSNPGEGNQKTDGKFDSNTLGVYITGLTVVVAIVTGFYLSMLHSATKYARESAKEARDSVNEISENYINEISENKTAIENNKTAIENIKDKRSDIDRMLVSHLQSLNKKFLLPMFDDLEFLMGANEDKQEKIEKHIRLLQAELSLFYVIETENCGQFIQKWNDVAAYQEDVFNQNDYSHLFRLARERLEVLCEECTKTELQEVDKIKAFIRYYEYQVIKK
jgi:hypothetical protein